MLELVLSAIQCLNEIFVLFTCIFFVIFVGVGNGLQFGQEINLHYDDWSPKVCKDDEFQMWFESLEKEKMKKLVENESRLESLRTIRPVFEGIPWRHLTQWVVSKN